MRKRFSFHEGELSPTTQMEEDIKFYTAPHGHLRGKRFHDAMKRKTEIKAKYGLHISSAWVHLDSSTLLFVAHDGNMLSAKKNQQVPFVVLMILDFVSPENIQECIRLTEEFRKLPINHRAREDKLEIKKMILHAMHQAITDYEELTTAQKM
ncbi:hypothetical protein OSB04_002622 [Centaurea solstitialis]|uniref:Uncharacterized protein n=1 Tax=Centaurea solstitialis TaxID=347529 RepID=A0AA38U5V3_9ASTR|nr:hypothetical protein OSB04_002622 [Centaurea solstitialis]